MGRRNNTITDEEKLFGMFYAHNNVRSKKARDVDNASTKGVDTNLAKWWAEGGKRSDWPGIDTVVRVKPKGYTKNKGKRAFDNITDVIGSGGF